MKMSPIANVKVPAGGLMSDMHGGADYRSALITAMAERAVNCVFECVQEGLQRDGTVQIMGFGTVLQSPQQVLRHAQRGGAMLFESRPGIGG